MEMIETNPFSDSALASVARHFPAEFAACGHPELRARELTAVIQRTCRQERATGFGRIAAALDDDGIRRRWNERLDRDRTERLSEWLLPHVRGTLLDLLSGSGAVAGALSRLGTPGVTAVERIEHMGSFDAFPRVAFDRFRAVPRSQVADTVLLSTVLHHEADPLALLGFAAELARERIIIVENCIDPDHPRDYQEFVDLFFNFCLNCTGLPAGSEHRTAAEWCRIAGQWGTATIVETCNDVPGIPLSHSLIVVDLPAPGARGATEGGVR